MAMPSPFCPTSCNPDMPSTSADFSTRRLCPRVLVDAVLGREAKSKCTAQFKLKIDELAFFAPSLARKTQSVTRKRVNVKRRKRHHLAGVDGCHRGWIVAYTARGIENARLEFVERWKDIQARFDIIAVDMPIGLSESGYRECEVEARKILRPHGSREFRVPARGTLAFAPTDWAGANTWSKHQGYGGISKQA